MYAINTGLLRFHNRLVDSRWINMVVTGCRLYRGSGGTAPSHNWNGVDGLRNSSGWKCQEFIKLSFLQCFWNND